MRLWSLHPKYLDSTGLTALWREALLAKKVLEGETVGYRNHPQLLRFKSLNHPLVAINSYLYWILQESIIRGYKYDSSKIEGSYFLRSVIPVTQGQIKHEISHLSTKLKERKGLNFSLNDEPEVNPIFYIVPGPVEKWEKSYDSKKRK